MATIFLRSTDGNDANAGTQKEASKATFAAALTAAGAGGRVVVSSIHAETQASAMTLLSPGTSTSPTEVICVADWGAATGTSVPTTLATTGTVSTTGANTITCYGFVYGYGVTLVAGNSTGTASINFTSTAAWCWVLESCSLVLGASGAASRITFGGAGGARASTGLILKNSTIVFSATGQSIIPNCTALIQGGSIAATGSVPTTLFVANAGFEAANIYMSGVNLSAITGTLFTLTGTLNDSYTVQDCKLRSGITISTGSIPGPFSSIVRVINSDSANTNYRYYRQVYQGTITHETTIVRTSGATDGTTPISRKMVSTANSKLYSPLESDPIVFWLDSTSSTTVTIPVVTDNVTLTDADCWIEVEELGTSGYPQAVTVSDRCADILATPANQTTDGSSTWTTTGLTTPVKQQLSVTFTPASKGSVRVRVMLAKASTTVYFDPLALSGSGRQWMAAGGYINEGPSGTSGGLIGGGNLSGGFL